MLLLLAGRNEAEILVVSFASSCWGQIGQRQLSD